MGREVGGSSSVCRLLRCGLADKPKDEDKKRLLAEMMKVLMASKYVRPFHPLLLDQLRPGSLPDFW